MITSLGKLMMHWLSQTGGAAEMVRSIGFWLVRSRFEFKQFVRQSVVIGVESFGVTALTSLFTGMVLALQAGNTINSIFGDPIYVGTIVSFSLIRELGPVLTGVVVAGRAGAAVTAHIGTMAVTEQLDALHTLGTNPTQYLVIPRMFAFLLTMPILTVFSNFFGIIGGWLVAVYALGVPGEIYTSDITTFMDVNDFMHGFLKSFVFAFLVATVCCYKGISTRGGAEGVGKATTGAVVTCIVMILVLDYFLTAILTAFGI
ncbi:MlaE family lipid ABC transporter permease subunit [Candidatus Avelusimicrobium facis]|uniref:MlaE family ABC transporter permease n=1 Tax=Candidatus Avelusimicrobium facis TaxID=3416203 RepID=UPI0015B5E2C9